jgi:hypothetical protein
MLISPDSGPIPTAEELVVELDALVRRRGAPQLQDCRSLLTLSCIASRSAEDSPHVGAAALTDLLPQVAARLRDPPRSKAALALLSLDGPLVRASPGTRRQAAANALGMKQAESFRRRHEQPLLADLGAAFVAVENAYRVRSRRSDEIDWLLRFESYYRIYTPIAGLRGDLLVLLRTQRERPDEFDYLIAQLGSSLWFYARLLRQLERFVDEHGGLWLFSDSDVETDVANAVQHLLRHPDRTQHDDSWLRLALGATPAQDLDPFLERLVADARGAAILESWVAWCRSCACPAGPPLRDCEVHAVLEACQTYIEVLDRETVQLGQPYREQLRAIPAEDITDLIKRFGAVRGS